jgi:hypothetical protein
MTKSNDHGDHNQQRQNINGLAQRNLRRPLEASKVDSTLVYDLRIHLHALTASIALIDDELVPLASSTEQFVGAVGIGYLWRNEQCGRRRRGRLCCVFFFVYVQYQRTSGAASPLPGFPAGG